jgi:c(7)-type cytochrome triheme protein
MTLPATVTKPSLGRRLRYALSALVAVPIIALGAPDQVRIPPKAPHEKGDPADAALFSHWGHSDFQCYSCHPSIFPQRRVGFTHADMDEGRFCGSCHDGQQVWAPKGKGVECETCHVPAKADDIDEDDIFGMFGGRLEPGPGSH